MDIDKEYLKKLLKLCKDDSPPTFTIAHLMKLGIDVEAAEFEFHWNILGDESVIVRADGEPGVGIHYRGGMPGAIAETARLRITSDGLNFIEALENSDVWAKLKTEVKGGSLKTLKTISAKLLEAYLKKKVEDLMA